MKREDFIYCNQFLLATDTECDVVSFESAQLQGRFFKSRSYVFVILNKDESSVIKLRYGVDTGKPLTFKQVAEKMKISLLDAQELHESAFKKLKNPLVLKLMRNYNNHNITNACFEEIDNNQHCNV